MIMVDGLGKLKRHSSMLRRISELLLDSYAARRTNTSSILIESLRLEKVLELVLHFSWAIQRRPSMREIVAILASLQL